MAQVETGVKKKIKEYLAERPPILLIATPTGVFYRYNKHGELQEMKVGFEGLNDFLGARSIVITPEMVGHKVAVLFAIEAKKPKTKASAAGQLTQPQANFQRTVRNLGGIALVARSAEDLKPLTEDEQCRQLITKSPCDMPVAGQSTAKGRSRKGSALPILKV